jgi:hypothetical protein
VPPYDVAGTIHRALIEGGAVLLSRDIVFGAGGAGLWGCDCGTGVHGAGRGAALLPQRVAAGTAFASSPFHLALKLSVGVAGDADPLEIEGI